MLKAKVIADSAMAISKIDERIYSSFIEHLGRAVYTGIYEKGHERADECGFREDVIELIKELNIPLVRYPGGNFVSGYYWEDGVGPKEKRPKRIDTAWKSVESNEFGFDEAASWAKKAGTSLMMAVNLGTRGVKDAVNLLEYSNLNTPTKYSQMRKENGHEKPYNIKLWCLGNEMDGPWQTGHKSAKEYATLARETAREMRRYDPSIELVASGSSGSNMKTFPSWERIVLSECYDDVDYISMHQYYENYDGDTASFLASNTDLDAFISKVAATIDYVKAEKRSTKDVYISLDEWNVWYHTRRKDDDEMKNNPWREAPHLLEDVYNTEDALVVGAMLITILRHSDRVKIACLAQLVNVIAPIMTRENGGVWKQTIYYPFYLASKYGRGNALLTKTISESYESKKYGLVSYLDAIVTYNKEKEEAVIFALNRSLDDDMELSIDLRGFQDFSILEQMTVTSENLKDTNTEIEEKVKAERIEVKGKIVLPKASWNVIRLKIKEK